MNNSVDEDGVCLALDMIALSINRYCTLTVLRGVLVLSIHEDDITPNVRQQI